MGVTGAAGIFSLPWIPEETDALRAQRAAAALGLRLCARLRHVHLPRALQRLLPPLANAFITLIKETSLAAVIGFDELCRQEQLVVANSCRAFEVHAAVALVDRVLTSVAARVFQELEQRLRPAA